MAKIHVLNNPDFKPLEFEVFGLPHFHILGSKLNFSAGPIRIFGASG